MDQAQTSYFFEDRTFSIAKYLRLRSKTSREHVLEKTLERAWSLNPILNAFLLFNQASPTIRRGSLGGATVGVKDIFYTKDLRTTAGSKILAKFVPSYDATVVAKLKRAGCFIVGKTNTHEFALGSTSINPHYGWVRNPTDITRISGGSSGGSAAAVAAGMSLAALGSDTRGSVRIPAALCGVTGFKPTYGAISKYGVFPLSPSLDHVGLLTRTVDDARILFNLLAGKDPKDASTKQYVQAAKSFRGLGKTRFGTNSYFTDKLDRKTLAAFKTSEELLGEEGAELVPIDIASIEEVQQAYEVIRGYEAFAVHRKFLSSYRAKLYGSDVRMRLETGRNVGVREYHQALKMRALLARETAASFRDIDAIISPTTPIVAPTYQEAMHNPTIATDLSKNTVLFDVTGLPSISIPNNYKADSLLPTGLQLSGIFGADQFVLSMARDMERLLGVDR